ncbi:hypothetical protein O0L34_g13308 [Tuta absoluta]|nr:hypothetical protein O0L34_g13308 [Tuta absoluta]
MATPGKLLLLFLYASYSTYVSADDIERTARRGGVIKLLREMVNQTKADTLNLPANASSIRENIVDTFSCENRTYGYYADVDNECQVFHVCLTSQTSSGRNVTYRWSFICPNETIFNQEVLTCTRPRDSIDCEDSPMFYHLNMDIGKVNDTETQDSPGNNTNTTKNQRRKPIKRQNLIVENLMKEVKNENLVVENLEEELVPIIEVNIDDTDPMENEDLNKIKVEEMTTKKSIDIMKNKNDKMENKPVIHDVNGEYKMKGKRMENARLSSERSLKRRGKKISRGTFRFKADV